VDDISRLLWGTIIILLWIAAIIKGVKWARQAGASPHWMWLGVFSPFVAFIAYAVFRHRALDRSVSQHPDDTKDLPTLATTVTDTQGMVPLFRILAKLSMLAGICFGCLAAATACVALWTFGNPSEEITALTMVLLGIAGMIVTLLYLPCRLFDVRRSIRKALEATEHAFVETSLRRFATVYRRGSLCLGLSGFIPIPCLFIWLATVYQSRIALVRLLETGCDQGTYSVLDGKIRDYVKNGRIAVAQVLLFVILLFAVLLHDHHRSVLIAPFASPMFGFLAYYFWTEALLLRYVARGWGMRDEKS
jgi:hypothetical protein